MRFGLFLLLIVSICGCELYRFKENRSFQIKALNDELIKLSDKHQIEVLNTHSIFLDSENTPVDSFYNIDGLHLSKSGYANWINKGIKPLLASQNYQSIGMIGNSITAKIELFSWPESNPNISNWELLLSKPTQNFGISGNTSRQVLDRIHLILENNLDCYFLLIGINDIAQGVPLWKIVEQIETIVEKIKARDSKIILQLVFPIVTD